MKGTKPLPESDLEPLREAAARLSLDESTVRKGLAGTGSLTKIYQGTRCFLDRAEVTAHIKSKLEAARAKQGKSLAHVFPQ